MRGAGKNWRTAGSFSALIAERTKTETIERRDMNFIAIGENPCSLSPPSFIVNCDLRT